MFYGEVNNRYQIRICKIYYSLSSTLIKEVYGALLNYSKTFHAAVGEREIIEEE